VIKNTDVFIIGGGPAGLACAIAARRRGLDVAIADGAEPPIDKACGEGLMPTTLTALHDLGIEIDAAEGFAFRGIRFLNGAERAQADFPGGQGLGLRRLTLHQKLITRAQESGVQFHWKTPVTGLCLAGVVVRQQVIRARWIVGADGIRSRVRRWSGLEGRNAGQYRYASRRHYRIAPWTNCVDVHWGEGVQAYVTPVGVSDVCIVLVSRDPGISFELLEEQFPELHDRLVKAAVLGTERGAVTATGQLESVYRGNVALIGDASGSVDAITGEGLGLSFRQAAALAKALFEGNLRHYQEAHVRLARQPRVMARLLLLLDCHAALRRRVVRTLSTHPELFSRLLAMHQGGSSPAHVLSTGTLLGWRLVTA
jgi:flavin-dependent dehydrogenase